MRTWTLLVCLTLLPLAAAGGHHQAARAGCEERPCDRGGQELHAFDGKHVSFGVDADNVSLLDYSRGDLLLFDSLQVLPEGNQTARAVHDGGAISVYGDEWRLRIQDNPTANLAFKGDGTVVFDLPPGAEYALRDEGARITYGDVVALIVADGLVADGDRIWAEEFAAFHLPARDPYGDDDSDEDDEPRDARVRDAIEKRRLGAEVRIQRAAEPQVNQYDDVEITIETPDRATPDTPLLVTFSADLPEGRTFVLDVDQELLAGPELALRYFTLYADGSRSEERLQMASSLDDILDPSDDEGPEYWIVQDAHGLQVMASVPAWSVHQISIASIGEFLTQPSVIIGVAAGIGGVAVAALVLLRPRRQAF